MASSSCPPELVAKNRRIGFLIWQSLVAASIYFASSLLLGRHRSLLRSISSFTLFHLAQLFLGLTLSFTASPTPCSAASPICLASTLARLFFGSFIAGYPPIVSPETRRRGRRALENVLFLLVCGVSGSASVVGVCWDAGRMRGLGMARLCLQGLVFGAVYGVHYVYWKRWVLTFPIIQRSLYFSFKMGISPSFKQALRLSTSAFFCSAAVMIFFPDQIAIKKTIGRIIVQQISLYVGIFCISFCWELGHHLHQVLHTRRCIFAPTKDSTAAEINLCGTLLEVLEQSSPRSLLQYLAYLDLNIISECNIDRWRRVAFFEETGETYKRVMSACLRPIEEFTSKLVQVLENFRTPDSLNKKSGSLADGDVDLTLDEAYNDFQLYMWCAKTAAALTAHSRAEDCYGVAQLTGCNGSAVTTLLSCLLAIEVCMGKKIVQQPAHQMGPGSIRWAALNTIKPDTTPSIVISKKRVQIQAYTMADVLRTSIYQIVSAFESDMQSHAKASVLEKNWITEQNPIYGAKGILLQKLLLFLDFRAV